MGIVIPTDPMVRTSRPFPQALTATRLLATLPVDEACALARVCEPVPLVAGAKLHGQGDRLLAVVFPTSGFVSMRARLDDRPSLEVAQVGAEGMIGLPLLMSVPVAIDDAIVQGAGSGLRVSAEAFGRLLDTSPALCSRLDQYACLLASRLTRSVACVGHHPLQARLARWLLGSCDRAGTAPILMTQDALASTLGVRRAAVTESACALQRRALIRYRRGSIEILDRAGLEAASCGCYAADCRDWNLLMQPRPVGPRRPRTRRVPAAVGLSAVSRPMPSPPASRA